MKTFCMLYVTRNGGVRSTKYSGTVKPGEVAFSVTLDIPDSVFVTPNRTITIHVPEPIEDGLHIEATALEVWNDDGGIASEGIE